MTNDNYETDQLKLEGFYGPIGPLCHSNSIVFQKYFIDRDSDPSPLLHLCLSVSKFMVPYLYNFLHYKKNIKVIVGTNLLH